MDKERNTGSRACYKSTDDKEIFLVLCVAVHVLLLVSFNYLLTSLVTTLLSEK